MFDTSGVRKNIRGGACVTNKGHRMRNSQFILHLNYASNNPCFVLYMGHKEIRFAIIFICIVCIYIYFFLYTYII